MDVICRFRGHYDWLSNFYPAQVIYKGVMYPTSEHAFQAQKTEDPKVRRFISKAPSPATAKSIGRTLTLREGWEGMKNQVMYNVVWKKFSTNSALLDKLIKTEGKTLIEGNTWGDRYWGVDEYGNGLNFLGQILMKIRSEIVQVYEGGKLRMRPVEVVVKGVVGPYEK